MEKKYLEFLLVAFQSVIRGDYLQNYQDLLISPDLSYSSLIQQLTDTSQLFKKEHFRNDFQAKLKERDIRDISKLVLDIDSDYYFCMIKYLEYEEKRGEVLRCLNKTGFYLQL